MHYMNNASNRERGRGRKLTSNRGGLLAISDMDGGAGGTEGEKVMKLTNTIEAHRHKFAVIIFHTSIDKFVFNLYTILRKARI